MGSTLYERLGGREAIAAVVAEFCARSVTDARIAPKFARTDGARLEAMLVAQLCEATGGPTTYTGRDMKQAHAGMQVTAAEFDAQVDVLIQTLDSFAVPTADRDAVVGLLAPMRADIVEVESDATAHPFRTPGLPAWSWWVQAG